MFGTGSNTELTRNMRDSKYKMIGKLTRHFASVDASSIVEQNQNFNAEKKEEEYIK